ncbi:DUF294 nucleotidyltransferase-like domain-containing protein [Neobacillus niacini]|uniref:DUF294 nucleotidyltransferase-like domain-containing protein n=1 Tax=Neobacillus niacini TaxID=86668 RepID=UPI00285A726C|nr:DUF294 nucleotidyltransferase-like domain-containing protein [Neobacillus niacini]MDR7002877.1 CBS domain-containing protein [Neobacillus niacini]
MIYESFQEIRNFRDSHINNTDHNHFQLNHLHDEIIQYVINTAILHITNCLGPPPSPFSFFVMGSAGRFEQSTWSDQDHGIIYQNPSDAAKDYFLALGKEISHGLYTAGYPYCEGGVMADHPLWCKSYPDWQRQLLDWMTEASWESIRHLLIFMDGRSLYGETAYIQELKTMVFQKVEEDHLLPAILKNTLHVKKGIGILGQLLVETHGKHAGQLNLKEMAFLPYANAVRVLAIQDHLQETSTLSRLSQLKIKGKEFYKNQFSKLLEYRLLFGNHSDYEAGHYLPIAYLTKVQRNEVRNIIKNGMTLFQSVIKLVGKED